MIDVSSLTYAYPKKRENTIEDVSFSIQKGEIFGLLGPSGAGKSTIQKIITGILKGYRGSVKVMGRELRQVKSDYYEEIGVGFELPNLYSKFTALENLDFFRSLYAGETEDPGLLLAMVGLEKDAGTRVSEFSKGMKMRLVFCRAFLNKPELLFLDEPTSGLDPANAKRIKRIILDSKTAGKTIFLTTHNMNLAEEICDRVAFIVDGRIKLIDSPGSLKVARGKKVVRVEYRSSGPVQSSDFELAGLGGNSNFIKLIAEQDIQTMHTLEASLEDIFIQVTGRSLT
ncbi:MAG: hypothetical protein JL50_21385 [Peptococcaceae bacterium BICA1-7]|nr:MAG: hypothetical protein JL50_21385 [Peptococcaceae bacterium BICA1-7]HBV97117.1 ABC transporter ATP-binding protein [Desulfotomaculum sp.]